MQPEVSKTAVFFDGSCALRHAEIDHYGRQIGSEALCFIDVSQAGASLPPGLTRQKAVARFHALSGDGKLMSGACGVRKNLEFTAAMALGFARGGVSSCIDLARIRTETI